MRNQSQEYLAENLKRTLASDPRVSVQDISVTISKGIVYLQGQVTTQRRKNAAAQVVNEMWPGLHVVNQLTIIELREPGSPEVLK